MDLIEDPRDPHEGGARPGPRGFTLLELLVVMLLIGILLGMGAGVYVRLGETLRQRTALGRVRTLIRKTRNFSLSGGGPAVLYLDRASGRIHGTGNRPVGLWHFEDARGAFGRRATITGGEIVPGGRFGRGIRFDEGGGMADLGASPEFDPPEGFLAELWVRPEDLSPRIFLAKGRAWELGMDGEGHLRGSLRLGGGSASLRAPGDALPVHRWARVGILYDGSGIRLLRDGRIVASAPESARLEPDRGAPLTVGSRREPLVGWADEVRIVRMVPGEGMELPEEMRLVEAPPAIVFRAGGSLDPGVHRGPVTLRFHGSGGQETLTVGLLGMILEGGAR